MKLSREKVRKEQYYTVGYDDDGDQYILSVVIPWVAWYNRYYRISKEEYDWFDTNPEILDLLAEECFQIGPYGDRFVYSDKTKENK